jgi:hypothetical protein
MGCNGGFEGLFFKHIVKDFSMLDFSDSAQHCNSIAALRPSALCA